MTLKHSPSPWKVVTHNWSDTSIYDANSNVIMTQCIKYDYSGTSTTEANQHELEIKAMVDAQLIAAAPDLLEALLDMVSDRECLSDATVNNAKKAIAKAKGE